jgi:hypothetical protein
MRKLFLDWLEKEPQSYIQQRGFQLAAQVGLKEALPIALNMLAKKDVDQWSKTQAMTALVKLGSKEHVPVLEPYLKDTSQVTTINFGNGDQFTVQVRDVAMGVQIQLAGQKMSDYGYDNRFGGGWTSPHYYGFRDDKARDDAHAKWKDWAAKNLKAPEKKPAESPKEPQKKEPETAKEPAKTPEPAKPPEKK